MNIALPFAVQIGDSNTKRVASRVNEDRVNAANMLLMLLPGTVFPYYGDEIGMKNVDISFADTRDPVAIKAGQVIV